MTVVTDHSAVKAILKTPSPSGKHARWWLKVVSKMLKLSIDLEEKMSGLTHYQGILLCQLRGKRMWMYRYLKYKVTLKC